MIKIIYSSPALVGVQGLMLYMHLKNGCVLNKIMGVSNSRTLVITHDYKLHLFQLSWIHPYNEDVLGWFKHASYFTTINYDNFCYNRIYLLSTDTSQQEGSTNYDVHLVIADALYIHQLSLDGRRARTVVCNSTLASRAVAIDYHFRFIFSLILAAYWQFIL